jgi:hypothetical protein
MAGADITASANAEEANEWKRRTWPPGSEMHPAGVTLQAAAVWTA